MQCGEYSVVAKARSVLISKRFMKEREKQSRANLWRVFASKTGE